MTGSGPPRSGRTLDFSEARAVRSEQVHDHISGALVNDSTGVLSACEIRKTEPSWLIPTAEVPGHDGAISFGIRHNTYRRPHFNDRLDYNASKECIFLIRLGALRRRDEPNVASDPPEVLCPKQFRRNVSV